MIYEVVELSRSDLCVAINFFEVLEALVYVVLGSLRVFEVHRRVLEDLHELLFREGTFFLYVEDAEELGKSLCTFFNSSGSLVAMDRGFSNSSKNSLSEMD